YHTDLQEDKERLFDAVDTLKACLTVMTGMLATLRFNRERMAQAVRRDFSNATDMADYLAKKGMPFRQAHEVVGRLVLYCIERGKYLADCTLEELKEFSPLFEADVYEAIAPETCVNLRTSQGGTAPAEVERQIALAAEILARRLG
ncbi:MAG: argininosuccinate lyase, partial [Bacillota bacterium]